MAKSRRNSVKKNKTRTRPKTRPKTKNRRRRNLRRSYKLRGAGIADFWNSVTGTNPTSVTGTIPTSVSGTIPTSVTGTNPTSVTGTIPTSVTGTNPTSVSGTIPTSVPSTIPTSVTGNSFTDLWNSGNKWFNNATGQPPVNAAVNNQPYKPDNTMNPFTQNYGAPDINPAASWYQAPVVSSAPLVSSNNGDQYGPVGVLMTPVGASNSGNQVGPDGVLTNPIVSLNNNNGDQDGPVGVLMNPVVSSVTNGGKKRMTKRRVIRGGQSLEWLKNIYGNSPYNTDNLGHKANIIGSQAKYVMGNNFTGAKQRFDSLRNNTSTFILPKDDPSHPVSYDGESTSIENRFQMALITYLTTHSDLKLNRSQINVGDTILILTNENHYVYIAKVLSVDDNNGKNDNLQVQFLDCYRGRIRFIGKVMKLLKKDDLNNVFYSIPDIKLPQFGNDDSQNKNAIKKFIDDYTIYN